MSPKKKQVSRRAILKGILGGAAVAVTLPTLDCMLNGHGTAFADGAAIPNRYGVWWWGNGVRREHWIPERAGRGFDLKAETMPFAGVKDYMTMLTGYDVPSAESAHNAAHAWLTAGHSDHSKTYHTPGSQAYSHDQIVADAWAGQTPIHSLQLGVSRMGYEGNGTRGNTSYADGGAVMHAEFDPQSVFDRIFVGVGGDDEAVSAELRRARGRRASVLDAVMATSTGLEARVGAADRARLDQHFTAIRELEVRLSDESMAAPIAPICDPRRTGARGTGEGEHNSREPLEETHEAMAEILRLAFACDITRVFSMQFIKHQGSTIFWQVGTDRQLHDITHDGPQDLVHDINVFMMTQFSVLLEKLRDTPVGAENLLHYSTILGTSEVGEGSGHQSNNLPMVLFGKGGGRLEGDQRIDGGGTSTSRAILAAIHSTGVEAESFAANEGRATEPAPGILV